MSNKLFFTGRLAEAVQLTRHGNTTVADFTLIRNEYAGKDANGKAKQRKVSLDFTAFDSRAEFLAEQTRTGDQLMVEARVQNERWTDKEEVERFGHGFIVINVERGAPGFESRELIANRIAEKERTAGSNGDKSVAETLAELDDVPF